MGVKKCSCWGKGVLKFDYDLDYLVHTKKHKSQLHLTTKLFYLHNQLNLSSLLHNKHLKFLFLPCGNLHFFLNIIAIILVSYKVHLNIRRAKNESYFLFSSFLF